MLFILVFAFFAFERSVYGFRCDRRPYGSTTQASPADGRFKLVVNGADDTYIPEQLYTVQITETDGESRFTGFMISVEGEIRPDPKNPRRLVTLSPGELRPEDPITAKFSDRCLFSVEHAMSSEKSSVEVYWQAPATSNGCVILRAMVAETEDIWYEDGTPLTLRLCEDMRQPDDMTPLFNYECQICSEAKYEVSFTGIWSRHTHPRFYPENDWTPGFSNLVGASHAFDYTLWAPGSLASEGFRVLAEHANSSMLEEEIRNKIGEGVRTVIKGRGHGYRKMNTPSYSFFRADRTNHLFSVAVALYPSPDWFLGVTKFELCQVGDTWLEERELKLFPWDAGTDSGVSYESADIRTYPQGVVGRVEMSSYDKNSPFYEMDIKDLHPFGKLRVKLIKIYDRVCKEESEEETTTEAVTTVESETESEDNPDPPSEPDEPSSEAPINIDPDSSKDCPLSEWQAWSPCEGVCQNGKILDGYQWRERYHLVDGVAVEKYDPDADDTATKPEVPKYCKEHFQDYDGKKCEDDCEENDDGSDDLNAEKRVMEPVAPGHAWNSKKKKRHH